MMGGMVHEWEKRGIDGGEKDVGTPADTVDHDRRDHNDDEVEEPVRDCRYCVSLPTGAEGINFRGVQLGGC